MDRKELIKKLRIFKRKIEKKYNINKIILFGSRANGRPRKESDVDLIVVGAFTGNNNLKRAPPLYIEWDLNLPVDFLCYTPEEFENLKNRVTIVREANKSGIVID